jgi:4-amino-4-deoxy-L-arabinose transferase-like glycosyltransferase
VTGAAATALPDTTRTRAAPLAALELVGLVALVVVAAALRLPGLAARGTWDGDQAHDMLVLRAFVVDGVVPLLGPPTSIGDFHHGALYYYLLAPAAAVTGGDSPFAVVLLIALAGIAAVAVTWWLARSIAGPVAGLVAGLLMAVSIAAVDESTFIWNPNLIPLSSSVALAGAWAAWSRGRPRWWLVAAAGTAVTMQCHVLAVFFFPVIAALWVADVRRRGDGARGDVLRAGGIGLLIIAVSYLPLLVNELTTDFSETRAALDYLAGGRESSDVNPVSRLVIVALRVVSWPLVGLIVDAFIPAILVTVLVGSIAIWGWRRAGAGQGAVAVRWLGLGLLWSSLALAAFTSSLAVVVRALPNDHYHAFADPMVFTLVGVGAAAAWSGRGMGPVLGRVGAVVLVGLLVGWNLLHQPPSPHPDGGWPAAEVAGGRIGGIVGERATVVASLPDIKSPEAYVYPLVRDGRAVVTEPAEATALVIVCDTLWEEIIGDRCGGPAEAALAEAWRPGGELVDRWEAAPGRVLSVYVAP